MEFLEHDQNLTVKEIEKFIEENDVGRVFSTRHRWHENFVKHFEQIMAVKQIVTYRKDGRLTGLCSFCLVDNDRKRDINKSRWVLPENISEGNIFYVDVCLLREGTSIFKIKTYLKGKLKPEVDTIFWYDIPNSRVFRLKIKGGVKCPK